jgi:glycosyltransferase involved in cell wall biosynthesis
MDPGNQNIYGGNLFEEVENFAQKCMPLVQSEEFDVIHCHDWLTFKAGILAKELTGKPLILHVHTTELDRSCGGRNQRAFDIEKVCFDRCDKIIAVSNYTKNKIVEGYGIDPNKIEVVHNAIQFNGQRSVKEVKRRKVVLYFGRLSLHKGPDYFIKAAKKVLDYEPDTMFVVAGGGELLPELINMACQIGISNKILFTGKITDEEVHKIYEAADVYVMPSVSEPFGITALEAASHGTPIIISKNSGAKEVIKHCLEVDFWDTEEMANKIISLLRYPQLSSEMTLNAYKELDRISWKKQAEEVISIYNQVAPHAIDIR